MPFCMWPEDQGHWNKYTTLFTGLACLWFPKWETELSCKLTCSYNAWKLFNERFLSLIQRMYEQANPWLQQSWKRCKPMTKNLGQILPDIEMPQIQSWLILCTAASSRIMIQTWWRRSNKISSKAGLFTPEVKNESSF